MKITPKKIFNKIKNAIVKPLSIIKDLRSYNFLKRIAKKEIGSGGKIRVAFLVFEPETWEQQACVYEKMVIDPAFKVDVIVIPNFDRNFKVEKTYGNEKEFFKERCGEIILAYDENGNLYDLKKAGYDYIFYEDLYNPHYPKEYNTYKVCRYSRICSIPYGFTPGKTFLSCFNKDFFRGVYCLFAQDDFIKERMIKMFPKSYKKGVRRYVVSGYPVLDKYFALKNEKVRDKILWTPRWSYDKKIGGSHFLEFKAGFKDIKKTFPDTDVVFRPHPMMFTEFVKKGYLTQTEADDYLEALKRNGITKSTNASVLDDFRDTEILITDFSSIIIFYFLSGRPIIYAPLDTDYNEDYTMIIDSAYLVKTFEEVEFYLKKIKNGDDPMKEKREKAVEIIYKKHHGSADRIVNYLSKNVEGRSKGGIK